VGEQNLKEAQKNMYFWYFLNMKITANSASAGSSGFRFGSTVSSLLNAHLQ
jgi:hypothetical protein